MRIKRLPITWRWCNYLCGRIVFEATDDGGDQRAVGVLVIREIRTNHDSEAPNTSLEAL